MQIVDKGSDNPADTVKNNDLVLVRFMEYSLLDKDTTLSNLTLPYLVDEFKYTASSSSEDVTPVHRVHGARPMDTTSRHFSHGIRILSVPTNDTFCAAFSRGMTAMFSPSARILPDRGLERPVRARMSVLFPLPLRPAIMVSPPGDAEAEMFLISTFFPYPRVMFSICIIF